MQARLQRYFLERLLLQLVDVLVERPLYYNEVEVVGEVEESDSYTVRVTVNSLSSLGVVIVVIPLETRSPFFRL